MAGYLGAIPVPQATQHRESFTATSGQTTFNTAGYTVGFLDVYLNGSHLSPADFTATNGSDVVLASGASTGDVCDIISYTAFEVANQTFTGTTTLTGDLALGDNDKAIFGAGSDLQIYHDGSHSYIAEGGSATGSLRIRGENLLLEDNSGKDYLNAVADAQVELSYNGSKKFETASTGVDVTGKATLTSGELTFSGSISDPNGAAYIWRPADNTLAFGTANEERMRINSSGSVGIGTSSPSATLQVEGTTNGLQSVFGLDSSGLKISTFAKTGNDAGVILDAQESSNGTLTFATTGTERMRIDSSGNIFIGTIAEPSASQTGVRISGTNGQNFWKSSNSGTSGYDQLAFFNGNGLVGTISTSGSATAYNTSSDYRLKTDAQPMTGASARVLALKPVNFEWISDGSRVDGFLAHEAQAVVPEAVTGTKDGMKDEEYQVSAAKGDIYTPATDEADEVIHSANAEQPETLEDGKQWRETTPAVMGTRSVPDLQGIDQSKLVPLLVASLQEALARITALEKA